jgi:transposase-like protein
MKDDARHWRQLAQETRAEADAAAEPDVKTMLLEIAAAYEQLAVPAEERDARNPT